MKKTERLFKIKTNSKGNAIKNKTQSILEHRYRPDNLEKLKQDINLLQTAREKTPTNERQSLELPEIGRINRESRDSSPSKYFVDHAFKGKLNTTQFGDIPWKRVLLHNQHIVFKRRATFDVELSWDKMRFFIIIRRALKNTGEVKTITKTLWVPQAKQLIRLFDRNLTAMTNGLIKINNDMMVDWSFIDKINSARIGVDK